MPTTDCASFASSATRCRNARCSARRCTTPTRPPPRSTTGTKSASSQVRMPQRAGDRRHGGKRLGHLIAQPVDALMRAGTQQRRQLDLSQRAPARVDHVDGTRRRKAADPQRLQRVAHPAIRCQGDDLRINAGADRVLRKAEQRPTGQCLAGRKSIQQGAALRFRHIAQHRRRRRDTGRSEQHRGACLLQPLQALAGGNRQHRREHRRAKTCGHALEQRRALVGWKLFQDARRVRRMRLQVRVCQQFGVIHRDLPAPPAQRAVR